MLQALFRSRLRAKLISHLFANPAKRFFARQLEAILNESQGNISRELSRLESLGIILLEREGRQKFYRANEQCPIFPELQGIVLKTSGLADILRSAICVLGAKVKAAFVYGSMASGKGEPNSDVDVMVIGGVKFADVVSSLAPAQEALGREINPTVYAPEEFRSKVAAEHHFLTSVLAAPKIFLIGDPNELERLAQ